jgi:ABC-type transport system involved in multi-copper enzyme maturation permease subunit
MPKLVVLTAWFRKKITDCRLQVRVSILILALTVNYHLQPATSFAQGLTREECSQDTIAKLGCLPFYLGNIINGLFALSAIATIILIVLSGIRLLASGGDAGRVAKARSSLFYSIIGFIIVLSCFLILRVISFITGAECINALGVNTCN